MPEQMRRCAMGKAKDIREAVEEELSHDRLLDAAGITVRNLDGSVALTGTVPSYQQYLEAAEAPRRVTGVTRVHNHLEVRQHGHAWRPCTDPGPT
jgi:osmotically-inducible protein OsmY